MHTDKKKKEMFKELGHQITLVVDYYDNLQQVPTTIDLVLLLRDTQIIKLKLKSYMKKHSINVEKNGYWDATGFNIR